MISKRNTLALLSFITTGAVTTLLSCSLLNRSEVTFEAQDYFPLAEGNVWRYDMTLVIDHEGEDYIDGDKYLGEPFNDVDRDGVYNPYEPFTDQNGNSLWDAGEPYEDLNYNGRHDDTLDVFLICSCPENQDLNHNGQYDGRDEPIPPDMPLIDGVTYLDLVKNGKFDYPNGQYDKGETFNDVNNNRVYDPILKWQVPYYFFIDSSYTTYDGDEAFVFLIGIPQSVAIQSAPQYTFSNGPKGIRWWSHRYREGARDFLSEIEPLVITPAHVGLREGIKNERLVVVDESTSIMANWISIFDKVEDVETPAGRFKDCLRLVHFVSGWPEEMSPFNGTIYQWYAKGVGLVKQTGPAPADYWLLLAANVNGRNYP